MKVNLLLTILVVLALVVVAALTLRAVIVTQAVLYRGEAVQTGYTGQQQPQAAMDACGAEIPGQGQTQVRTPMQPRDWMRSIGIDPCQQDLNLRAPFGVEYAYMILRPKLFVAHKGGCGGLPTPGFTS